MIIVRLDEIHARGCGCDELVGILSVDPACQGLRDLIADEEGAEGAVYVKAVRPPA